MEKEAETFFEKKMAEYTRRGHIDRMKWMQNIRKVILPQYVRRIQQNDKTVLKELIMPEWVSWSLIYDWAMQQKHSYGTRDCILCGQQSELGIDFNEKYICDNCFIKLKHLRE